MSRPTPAPETQQANGSLEGVENHQSLILTLTALGWTLRDAYEVTPEFDDALGGAGKFGDDGNGAIYRVTYRRRTSNNRAGRPCLK